MTDPWTRWVINRLDTIEELRQLANNLKGHAKNAKIAGAIGSGISIVCGFSATACYFVAPITFGGSLLPATALTGIAAAGGAMGFGAMITNYFIKKGYMKSVQEALDTDRDSYVKLKKAIKKANKITKKDGAEGAYKIGKGLPGGISVATAVAKKVLVSEKVAKVLLKLGRTAQFGGHVVAVVALPFDIGIFVKDLIDLKKGNISKAAEEIVKFVDILEKELNDLLADF